jgi:hypothetical protein
MKLNTSVILVACAISFGAAQPAAAQAQNLAPDPSAVYKKDLAAYNTQCTGVTSSQAALYQQCAAQKAKLDSEKGNLSSANGQNTTGQIPLQMRGGSHGGGADD